jgi:hypothetical protein
VSSSAEGRISLAFTCRLRSFAVNFARASAIVQRSGKKVPPIAPMNVHPVGPERIGGQAADPGLGGIRDRQQRAQVALNRH